ncbi:hypothetical protein BGW41_003731, partial [Actinomortierella wolfii]
QQQQQHQSAEALAAAAAIAQAAAAQRNGGSSSGGPASTTPATGAVATSKPSAPSAASASTASKLEEQEAVSDAETEDGQLEEMLRSKAKEEPSVQPSPSATNDSNSMDICEETSPAKPSTDVTTTITGDGADET